MLHKHDKDMKYFFPLATELPWECNENLISYNIYPHPWLVFPNKDQIFQILCSSRVCNNHKVSY